MKAQVLNIKEPTTIEIKQYEKFYGIYLKNLKIFSIVSSTLNSEVISFHLESNLIKTNPTFNVKEVIRKYFISKLINWDMPNKLMEMVYNYYYNHPITIKLLDILKINNNNIELIEDYYIDKSILTKTQLTICKYPNKQIIKFELDHVYIDPEEIKNSNYTIICVLDYCIKLLKNDIQYKDLLISVNRYRLILINNEEDI